MKRHTFLSSAAALLFSISTSHADPLVTEIMPKVFDRAEKQTTHLLELLGDDPNLPRTIKKDGSLVATRPQDWTSGFFPGTLWFIHEYTGSEAWKNKALEFTQRLEVVRHFKGNHDGGFMLGCSYGNALRLAPDDSHRAVLRDAAAALGTRYNDNLGMIRSWDHGSYTYPVIIDNMMNLELLSWAAKNGGDAKLREIAVSHADQTHIHHFRPDGSAYHVVDYNPKTKWVRGIHGMQGADVRTPWARGQAWGLYGFVMMHREIGKSEYLERAVKLADFLIAHPNLPEDKIPYWDFGVEGGEDTPRDASAAAVIASAMIELSQRVDDGKRYLDFARAQLLSLASPAFLAEEKTNGGFILTRSTGHLPGNIEINVPLCYADYYFLEALLRYRAVVEKKERHHFGEIR